jgi:hypothetical protein
MTNQSNGIDTIKKVNVKRLVYVMFNLYKSSNLEVKRALSFATIYLGQIKGFDKVYKVEDDMY